MATCVATETICKRRSLHIPFLARGPPPLSLAAIFSTEAPNISTPEKMASLRLRLFDDPPMSRTSAASVRASRALEVETTDPTWSAPPPLTLECPRLQVCVGYIQKDGHGHVAALRTPVWTCRGPPGSRILRVPTTSSPDDDAHPQPPTRREGLLVFDI